MNKLVSFFGGKKQSSSSSSSSSSTPSIKIDNKVTVVSYHDKGDATSSSTFQENDIRNDYKNAHYYDYYRLMEQSSKGNERSKSGLQCKCIIPSTNLTSPTTIRSSAQDKFTLKSVNISTVLTDTCSVSTFKQHFVNNYDQPVEAFYQLPLPPQASVNGFTVEFNGNILKGVIKEKEEAFQEYTDAISNGGQAFLGEKSDDGYFSMSIGNLPPKTEVFITLDIISEVGSLQDSLHYCLHRFLFPEESFDFNINLQVNLSSPIAFMQVLGEQYQQVSQVTYSEDKKSATFITKSEFGVPNNYIVVIVPQSTPEPKTIVEYNEKDKSHAISISFYPSFTLDKTPEEDINQKMECIIIVDRSGSMGGDRIEASKRALEIMMRSLNENTMFNIVSFGSDYTKLFPSSLPYNDETLSKASSLIQSMDADMGGTQLFEPIENVLKMPALPEYPRQVFILTDGAVSRRQELIKFVAAECNTTRIFTLGIGSGVDKELVIGLSKACKGYYEMIRDVGGDFEERVLSLLSIATQPMLSNVQIDWEGAGLQVTQAPMDIRPVYNKERMMIYAMIEDTDKNRETINKGVVTLNLTGSGPTGNTLSFPITLNFSNASRDPKELVHSLAAYQNIQDLEALEKKKSENHKDRIVKLAKRFHLVSKHTSFVVTAESDQPTLDTMKQVDAKPKLEQQHPQEQLHRREADCERSSRSRSKMDCAAAPRAIHHASPMKKSMKKEKKVLSQSCYEEETVIPVEEYNPVLSIIRQQKANGSWSKKSKFEFTLPENKDSIDEDIWTTIVVIAHLQKVHAAKKAQWNMVVNKAMKWLKSQQSFESDPSKISTLIEKVAALLK